MISEEKLLEELREHQKNITGDTPSEVAARALLQIFIDKVNSMEAVEGVQVIRCRECIHWHRETGWCTLHSHFIDHEGNACHPWESNEWKIFNEDGYCSEGER